MVTMYNLIIACTEVVAKSSDIKIKLPITKTRSQNSSPLLTHKISNNL